jgi:indole-3-glycerol phosphate synthase
MSMPGIQADGAAGRARPSILERILTRTREDLLERKRQRPLSALALETPQHEAGLFAAAIAEAGIDVIAEFKRRSPSAGELRGNPDLESIVRAYEQGGACAISVLTDEPHFGGSLDDLRAARAACALPILRKDFIVDPYQLHEALAAGADAVLLIVAALDQPTLTSLHSDALELGLDALVEVHDKHELDRALEAGARLVGINNRDLRDFSVELERTFELLDFVPDGVRVVSESGISTHDQLRRMQQHGVAAVLVGETLMRANDPRAALLRLRGEPNAARA